MNKLQKTILIAGFALFIIGVLPVSSVSAFPSSPSNLTVDFEQTPLFSEANFMPGQAVTRYVDVTNNTAEKKIIGVKAKNYTSCSENCLADQLKLKITDGTKTLYGEASLTEFFAAGEKKLSELASGGITKYYFTITFIPETGNSYQGKQVGFDFDIGIFGQETIGGGDCGDGVCNGSETCNTCSADCGGCGGGGGGVVTGGGGNTYFGGETSLVIFNEAAEPVVSNQTDVTWETNHPATSRVIYSAETEAHIFQLENPPNYGYAHSTVEDTVKTESHTMNIAGLVPGVTYYYRVVSHGSFAVSTEHSFTVPLVKGEETMAEEGVIPGNAGGAVALSQGGENNNGGAGLDNAGEEPGAQETKTKEKSVNPFLAALPDLFKNGLSFCLIIFILAIIATILLFLQLIEKKHEEAGEEIKKRWIVTLIIIIAMIIMFSFLCPDYYKVLLLSEAIMFVIFLAIYFYYPKKQIK